MATVAAGLAQSIENLMHRLPTWRVATLRAKRSGQPEPAPGALAALIEGEIIPRLLVAHRLPHAVLEAPGTSNHVTADDVEAFAPCLIDHETSDLLELVDRFVERGLSTDSILIDLFAPAARVLGRGWDEDRYDFVDVTMGMWRLQELVHEMAARQPAPAPRPAGGRRALFASMPGDQHSFGVVMVEEVFRLAGWDVASWTDNDAEDLYREVHSQWLELIGLTLSNELDLDRAPAVIAACRARSRNPAVVIMVGGRVLAGRPELARAIGADATAPDPRAAVARAESLVSAIAAATAR